MYSLVRYVAAVLLAVFAASAPAQQPVVAAGADNTFAIATDGRLLGWGEDDGQLGLGRVLRATTPTLVPGAAYVAIAAGSEHALALTASDRAAALALSGRSARTWSRRCAGWRA